ncbi:MAG: hypothetical protein KKI08_22510 [Armatimonadetes bacterium]|nr:hypothetical protein [Armatimonadota bacterium]
MASLALATDTNVCGIGETGDIGRRTPVRAEQVRADRWRWLGTRPPEAGSQAIIPDPLAWTEERRQPETTGPLCQRWAETVDDFVQRAVADRLLEEQRDALGVAVPWQVWISTGPGLRSALQEFFEAPLVLPRVDALAMRLLADPGLRDAGGSIEGLCCLALEHCAPDRSGQAEHVRAEVGFYLMYREEGLRLGCRLSISEGLVEAADQPMRVQLDEAVAFARDVCAPRRGVDWPDRWQVLAGGDAAGVLSSWSYQTLRAVLPQVDSYGVAMGAAAAAWASVAGLQTALLDDWAQVQCRSADGQWQTLDPPLPLGSIEDYRRTWQIAVDAVGAVRVSSGEKTPLPLTWEGGTGTELLVPPAADRHDARITLAATVSRGEIALRIGHHATSVSAAAAVVQKAHAGSPIAPGSVGGMLEVGSLYRVLRLVDGSLSPSVCDTADGVPLDLAVSLASDDRVIGPEAEARVREAPDDWYLVPRVANRFARIEQAVVLRRMISLAPLREYVAARLGELRGVETACCVAYGVGAEGLLAGLEGAGLTAVEWIPAAIACLLASEAEPAIQVLATLLKGGQVGLVYCGETAEAAVAVQPGRTPLHLTSLTGGEWHSGIRSLQDRPVGLSRDGLQDLIVRRSLGVEDYCRAIGQPFDAEDWRNGLERAAASADGPPHSGIVGALNQWNLAARTMWRDLATTGTGRAEVAIPHDSGAIKKSITLQRDEAVTVLATLAQRLARAGEPDIGAWVVVGPLLALPGLSEALAGVFGERGLPCWVGARDAVAAGAAELATAQSSRGFSQGAFASVPTDGVRSMAPATATPTPEGHRQGVGGIDLVVPPDGVRRMAPATATPTPEGHRQGVGGIDLVVPPPAGPGDDMPATELHAFVAEHADRAGERLPQEAQTVAVTAPMLRAASIGAEDVPQLPSAGDPQAAAESSDAQELRWSIVPTGRQPYTDGFMIRVRNESDGPAQFTLALPPDLDLHDLRRRFTRVVSAGASLRYHLKLSEEGRAQPDERSVVIRVTDGSGNSQVVAVTLKPEPLAVASTEDAGEGHG